MSATLHIPDSPPYSAFIYSRRGRPMRPEDVPIPPAGAMARTKGEDFFDGFIWIFTFCGVGFALFSPRCQQYSGIFSLRGITLKPNFVRTILLSLRKIVVSRWFREVSCRARLLTDQS